jgi:aminoglycoside phosphotransferase (APT) family kinase protein
MWAEVLPPTSAEILEAFALRVGALRRHGLGWESAGWTDDVWFVKVWRDLPPANLAVLGQLRLSVPVPVAHPTVDGESFARTAAGRHYGVFRFFNGRHATGGDWRESARVLRLVHEHTMVDLPAVAIGEGATISDLRDRLDHPWIRGRRGEVEQYLSRLESLVGEVARHAPEPVLLHGDYGRWNLLVDSAGAASAILDWDHACIGPREHDVWVAFEHPDASAFLRTYGADRLDRVHLEYALLRRAVQDLAARVVNETDREGVELWGFARWRRLDADLARAAPFLV